MQWKKTSSGLDDIAVNHALTVHCKLDKVGHRSLHPPRNGTGVVLLEAGLCRVSLNEMYGLSCLSPYSKCPRLSNFYASVAYPHCCACQAVIPRDRWHRAESRPPLCLSEWYSHERKDSRAKAFSELTKRKAKLLFDKFLKELEKMPKLPMEERLD